MGVSPVRDCLLVMWNCSFFESRFYKEKGCVRIDGLAWPKPFLLTCNCFAKLWSNKYKSGTGCTGRISCVGWLLATGLSSAVTCSVTHVMVSSNSNGAAIILWLCKNTNSVLLTQGKLWVVLQQIKRIALLKNQQIKNWSPTSSLITAREYSWRVEADSRSCDALVSTLLNGCLVRKLFPNTNFLF